MDNLNNKNTLFELLAAGVIVVTPNNRLSDALLQQYFLWCNKKTVDKPICLPYTTFVTHVYQQLKLLNPKHAHPNLLNNAQCQYWWQKIIKSNSDITFSSGLLHAVMEAWEHCEQWQIDSENPMFHYTPQTRQFQQWWQTFNGQLKDLELISAAQLVPYLLEAHDSVLNQSIIWVCFDDFTPQQIQLQNCLHEKGHKQYRYELKERDTTPSVVTAKDNKEEYQQLIGWLHLKLEKGESRIGVVVPELQQESRSLQRILLQHIDPELFNISLGQALSEFPLVAHALAWLNLGNTDLEYQHSALLLQSSYIGEAKEEFIERAQYLQDSALLQKRSCSLRALSKDLGFHAPKLAGRLNGITAYPQVARADEWAHLFQERLNTIGFPGDYGLNSENYQCFNRFSTIFDEFCQLNLVSNSLSMHEALEVFAQLTHNTIFQAQKTNAPIQVSGLLEASGCEFDSLWVMGLTSQCLPKKTRLSAFIPPHLQRELVMPHSTPARELQFAQQTLKRLHNGSTTTTYSYSCLQGDTPNLPCSLISDFPKMELLPVSFDSIKPTFLIAREEAYHVPLKGGEHLSGGTALLGNQAKCPFKAFAEHRLIAKALPKTSDGLDNKEKGKIIHKVMELLWQSLNSQEELIKLNDALLDQYINQAIESALNSLSDHFPSLIHEIEHARLKRLTLSSLEWEKQRPPFKVMALEHSYSFNLAGLDIKVRVDRLDQVEDKKWVIDYKSSLPANKPWNEDRPKEPQLLLYVLLDEAINTMLFLQLKAGKTTCSGFSETKQAISGITSIKKEQTWDECRDTWQQQLTQLAEEIQQGYCPPQPAASIICHNCDFQNLCRFQSK